MLSGNDAVSILSERSFKLQDFNLPLPEALAQSIHSTLRQRLSKRLGKHHVSAVLVRLDTVRGMRSGKDLPEGAVPHSLEHMPSQVNEVHIFRHCDFTKFVRKLGNFGLLTTRSPDRKGLYVIEFIGLITDLS
jgi:hypothetical protein